MRFREETRFPADLPSVFAMLADPAFREKVAVTAGLQNWEVTVEPVGAGIRATLVTVQPTSGMPLAATSILGSSFEIHQQEDWSSPTEGRLAVAIPGKPGSVTGTVTLHEDGAETVQTVDVEIKVDIPLIGGEVEKLVGSGLGGVLEVQRAVGAEWLAVDR